MKRGILSAGGSREHLLLTFSPGNNFDGRMNWPTKIENKNNDGYLVVLGKRDEIFSKIYLAKHLSRITLFITKKNTLLWM